MMDSRVFGLQHNRLPGSKVGSIYGVDARHVILLDTTFVKDTKGRSRAILVAMVAGTRFSWVKVLGARTKAEANLKGQPELEVGPNREQVASFITDVFSQGCKARTIVCDKGREFRNKMVISRVSTQDPPSLSSFQLNSLSH